ncbi:hypothetical protein HYH02_000777 [Chlamydomonas schloesseri]|uniref:Ion transport domain-containing protein n=1 Tax=Chlamydomonas schloesseri TaxID=2026947 RepID=A0A835WZ66_9CHLO|nr:hypothetical protein HYH02_000777 [Chlamydomonas schloesseri]|eukprot:KAG2454950.1 hypothetical protein HYH02_000777 [Chlamydomonas schloesseri]
MKAEDYLQVQFSGECEVYVLLVNERAAVPAWVESKFAKVSESRMALKLDWHLPFHIKMMALMSQKLQICTGAHLNVWRGKDKCAPGQSYTFGGNEGRDTLLDYSYIFAWRPLDAAARTRADLGGGTGLTTHVKRGAEESLRLLQHHQAELEVQAVGDELEAFRGSFEKYTWHRGIVLEEGGGAAEQLRRLRPWYVTADGTLLAAACAAKTVSLKLMLLLVRLGAELDEVAARYLLNKVATSAPEALQVAAGFRDLRHLLLHYCYSRRRPVSSTLALAKVLDQVASERKAKYREYTELAATLRQLAMALVEKLDTLEAAASGGALRAAATTSAASGGALRAAAIAAMPSTAAAGASSTEMGEVRRQPSIGSDDENALVNLGPEAREDAATMPAAAGCRPGGEASSCGDGDAGPADVAYAEDDAAAARRRSAMAAGGGCSGGSAQVASLDDVLILPQHTQVVPPGVGGQQQQGGGGPTLPGSLSDVSPLDVACETKEVDFVSTSVVQGYLQRWWVGVDYTATALQDYGKMISYFDHNMTLRILQNGGFVGGLGMLAVRYFSYLVHYMLFCSRPFYDSPRGRWAFRLMCEAFFLYIFHSVQLAEHQTFMWQHAALALHVASMIVDELQELMAFYEGRPVVYFQDGFNIIEGVAMLLLVASGGCKATTFVLSNDDAYLGELQTASDFLFNTASIFVWARLLQFMIPLYDGMGSLLMVISKMTSEVLKFALPGVVIMLGVAFTLFATYRGRDIPGMDSFWEVMLALFRTFLGETMFDTLSEETSTLYVVYGTIVIVLYAVAATVVLANLLIALISSHFEPERAESQSRLQRADMVNSYNFMVRNQLLGAPFSLPLLLVTELLPSGLRPWAGDYGDGWGAYLVLPMDGLPMPPETRKERRYPKGSRELPYVIYLLTFYPAVMALTWAMWVALAPYCLAYFTLYGYRNWLEVLRPADLEEDQAAAGAGDGYDEASDRPVGGAGPPQVLKGLAGAVLGGGSGRLQGSVLMAADTSARRPASAAVRPLSGISNKVVPEHPTQLAKQQQQQYGNDVHHYAGMEEFAPSSSSSSSHMTAAAPAVLGSGPRPVVESRAEDPEASSAAHVVRPGSATLGGTRGLGATTRGGGGSRFSPMGVIRAGLAWFLLGLEPRRPGKRRGSGSGRRRRAQGKGAAAKWQQQAYQPWNHQERAASLAWLVLRTLAYITSRPLWLLLGLLLYVGGLGGLPVVLWGGVYQWLWRVAYYSHWVVRGWVEGWFPALDTSQPAVAASQQRAPAQAGKAGAPGNSSTHQDQPAAAAEQQPEDYGLDLAAFVGLQWARRLEQPPALSPADIRAAMRDAGLPEGDVALAVRGGGPGWKAHEQQANRREQVRRADEGLVQRLTEVMEARMRQVVRDALAEAGVTAARPQV